MKVGLTCQNEHLVCISVCTALETPVDQFGYRSSQSMKMFIQQCFTTMVTGNAVDYTCMCRQDTLHVSLFKVINGRDIEINV